MDKSEGNEMFYIDENGKKSDKLIHEQILERVEYSLDLRKKLKTVAMDIGLTEEQAELIYHCNESAEVVGTSSGAERLTNKKGMNMHLPPDKPRIRGLKLQKLPSEKRQLVEDIAKIVIGDEQLDLQLRDSYLNIYYLGGNLLKVTGLSPQSGRVGFHFDKKYFARGKNRPVIDSSWLPKNAGLSEWKNQLGRLKEAMDEWFELHPKLERKIQHKLCLLHRTGTRNSPWIVIDIEYAVWLHDSEKGRKLCRFDMIAVERKSIRQGQPLVLHLIEFKQGDRATSGASGVEKHAEDFRQFLEDPQEEKARDAFKESMRNVIREKISLGLLPDALSDTEGFRLQVSYLLKNCKVDSGIRTVIENKLSENYTEQLFMDYESWVSYS